MPKQKNAVSTWSSSVAMLLHQALMDAGTVLQALHSTRGGAIYLGPCHLAALAPLSEAQALAVLQQWAKRGGADDSLQLLEYLHQVQAVHRA
jgi:hypothetical protein